MTYHDYLFFSVRSSLRDLSPDLQDKYKKNFLKELQNEKKVITNSYVLTGLKDDFSLLLWMQSDRIENIQNFLTSLLHTKMGRYLQIRQTLLGTTRPTQYSSASSGHIDTERKGGAYLIIYPFTKTHEWYQLSFAKRKELMKGHIKIGRKHPQITQLLLYSYGIDDSEFIVSYETDDLREFQTLVMELRTDSVRSYTQQDTPVFTCVYKTPEEVLEFL